MSTETSMEKIKAFHTVKSFLTKDQQDEIAKMLGLTSVDINKRIWGKNNEIEFVLMIYLLGWCKSILGFEEGLAKLTDTIASDLYIELSNGKKIVVEIKSTEDSKFSISEKQFNEKVNFAQNLNADLFFAIKLAGNWTLYDSKYLESSGRKISLDNDFLKSQLSTIFGERTFIFPKGLKITSLYSKESTDSLGVEHKDFGYLTRYKIEYDNKKMFAINSKDNYRRSVILFYEHLHDVMSNQKQDVKNIDAVRTMVVEEFICETTMLSMSEFILAPIKHIMSEIGQVYDYQKYLIELIDKKTSFLTRQHILIAITILAEAGYLVLEKRDDGKLYSFKDMIIS